MHMLYSGKGLEHALAFGLDLLGDAGLFVVSCIETLTAPSLAAICLTRPKETMSA